MVFAIISAGSRRSSKLLANTDTRRARSDKELCASTRYQLLVRVEVSRYRDFLRDRFRNFGTREMGAMGDGAAVIRASVPSIEFETLNKLF